MLVKINRSKEKDKKISRSFYFHLFKSLLRLYLQEDDVDERGSPINVRGTSWWPGCALGALRFTPTGCFHDPAERDDPPTAGGRVAAWRTVWCPSQPLQDAT